MKRPEATFETKAKVEQVTLIKEVSKEHSIISATPKWKGCSFTYLFYDKEGY